MVATGSVTSFLTDLLFIILSSLAILDSNFLFIITSYNYEYKTGYDIIEQSSYHLE